MSQDQKPNRGNVVHVEHSPAGAFVVVFFMQSFFIKHKSRRVSIFFTDAHTAKKECIRMARESKTVIIGTVSRSK